MLKAVVLLFMNDNSNSKYKNVVFNNKVFYIVVAP